ncbi:endonuclease domain-containing protein [Streptomyces sp. NPDC005133]
MRRPCLLGQLRRKLRTVRHRLIHPVPPPTVRKAAWRNPLTTTAPATVASRQRRRRNHFALGRSRWLHDYSRPVHFRHAATGSTATSGRGVPRTRNGSRSPLANPRRTGRGARGCEHGQSEDRAGVARPPCGCCRSHGRTKSASTARGLYHPAHDSERRYCPHCHPKYADWAGVPVDPAVVPRTARCPENNRLWPNAAARPWHGPIPEFWTRPGKVPRWYVWWRLWGVQDGKCATCPGPPQVIDHDHTTGLVRGLLCYDCNAEEAACALDLALHWHSGICWYHRYWDSPPGPRSAGTGPTRSAKAASNRSCRSRQRGRLTRCH